MLARFRIIAVALLWQAAAWGFLYVAAIAAFYRWQLGFRPAPMVDPHPLARLINSCPDAAWFIPAACGIGILIWQLRRFTPQHHREGICRNCGYDLRATPERCPECGRAAS